MDTETQTLIAQDDHILGQERYPLNAWQTDEIIEEIYHISTTETSDTGIYSLVIGFYTWPGLVRLEVPNQANNVVELAPIQLVKSAGTHE
jgi:hypothetical protein